MKRFSVLIIVISISFFPFYLFSQNRLEQANLFIQNFNHIEYNTPENQIWDILQDQRGIMYFGNNEGILEFDGTNWNIIDITNKSTIRSLNIDQKTGRIYVGAVGELGYLQADSIGTLKYISLLNKIPENFKNFEDVWQIIVLDNQIIFRTTFCIFILKDDKIKTLTPFDRFHTGFCVNNQFYVREWGKGLMKLVNDSLVFVGQSGIFENERIYVMLLYENNKILIATRSSGIYIYSPNSIADRFIKPDKFRKVGNFITKNQTYCGIKLNNNQFAIGTLQDGVIIFNNDGEIIKHINKQSGLIDNHVLNIYSDSQNDIWVGLNNGISYIVDSPFNLYNENNGLEGTVYTSKIFNGHLYIGTSQGLYIKNKQNHFSLINETKGQSWNLHVIFNNLLLAHSDGIFIIKNKKAKKILADVGTIWNLNKLPKYPFILAGSKNGMFLLKYSHNKWELDHKIKGFNESSRYLCIDNDDYIWISHPNKGVFRIKLNQSLDSVSELNFFDKENGLPSNTENYIFKINKNKQFSRIVFGTENGIYRFNKATNRFVHDEKFNSLLKNKGFIDKFTEDPYGNIYFQQGHIKGVLVPQDDSTYKLELSQFFKLKDIYIEDISVVDTPKISFCSREGIIQFNTNIKLDTNSQYSTLIREVLANDSLILDGVSDSLKITELPYKYNNIQFSYSAIYYEDHNKTQYSYYLEGYNKQWSEWSAKAEKEYTNLPEGKYTFKVKAKNIYDKESKIGTYRFEILAPWYRSILAYIIYSIITFLIILLIVKFYTRKIKREKDFLEKIVGERTRNLHEINTQLEENQAELEIKSEEITAQAEHLVRMNEELENHKEHLEKIVKERTADLEKAKEKAEESDKLKSAFLANMSHEIRTPMNAIVGFSELLDDPEINKNDKKDIKYHITNNCQMLLRLVDDIIDIAKIEAGQLEINKQNCNVNQIFRELLEAFNEHKQKIKKQNIQISIYTEPDKDLIVYTDRVRLQQIITNLIDNALKYTEEGFIEYGYTFEKVSDKSYIKFFVKDSGIGISKEEQNIIFTRFTKVENNKKKIYRGAGLGLAISKNLANILGGDIWVESEINKGSTFYFTIPNIKNPENNHVVEIKKLNPLIFEWPEKTILVAEDEESNYQYFKMILSKTKANILHANTGLKVIDMFNSNSIDLILMDIKMPEMDGLEATRIIRNKNMDIPIIALTAFAMENDETLSLAAGCSAYISKPVQVNNLLSLINEFFYK